MLKFDKETYSSLLFKFILSERLSNKLFPEFVNTVPILF